MTRCSRRGQKSAAPFGLAQVATVLLIALIATAPEAAAGGWRGKALAKLQRQDDMELFAALPNPLPAELGARVEQLRLMSTGLTSGSTARWLRMVDTSREFLGFGSPPVSTLTSRG